MKSSGLVELLKFLGHERIKANSKRNSPDQEISSKNFLAGLAGNFNGLFLILDLIKIIIKPYKFNAVGSTILEDHASGVVTSSIQSFNGTRPLSKTEIAPKRIRVLISMIKSHDQIKKAIEASRELVRSADERNRSLLAIKSFLCATSLFNDYKFSHVFIARTNNGKRMGLALAASDHGIPIVAWTVERSGMRPPPPFRIQAQLCWTNEQKKQLESHGVMAAQLPMPKVPFRHPQDDKIRNGRLGILLSANVDIAKLLTKIKELDDKYGIKSIKVRPHPGFDMNRLAELEPSCLCSWREPLSVFFKRIDAAISMTSNVINDALLHGIPVLHTSCFENVRIAPPNLALQDVIPSSMLDEDPVDLIISRAILIAERFKAESESYISDDHSAIFLLKTLICDSELTTRAIAPTLRMHAR